MRPFFILERDRPQNRSPLLLIALCAGRFVLDVRHTARLIRSYIKKV